MHSLNYLHPIDVYYFLLFVLQGRVSYIHYWQEQIANVLQRILTQYRTLAAAEGSSVALPAALTSKDSDGVDVTKPLSGPPPPPSSNSSSSAVNSSGAASSSSSSAITALLSPPAASLPNSPGLAIALGQEPEVSLDELARLCHIQINDIQVRVVSLNHAI